MLKRFGVGATLLFVALVSAPIAFSAPLFQGLGVVGSNGSSYADSVSGDGLTVGGHGTGGVFRWTEAGGKQFVSTPANFFFNEATALSQDGSVVVGWADDERIGAFPPTIQRIGNPVETLWSLMRPDTARTTIGGATGVSADGSIVLGYGYSTTRARMESFLYDEANGLRYISDLTGDTRPMIGRAISSDGSIVAGFVGNGQITEAMTYDATHGIRGLGGLDGRTGDSRAMGISADGSTVVGWAESNRGQQAFLYRADVGMIGLGMLPSRFPSTSEATDVSGDGRIVVGRSETQAFIYDPENGMRSLRDYLVSLGLNLTGWSLDIATSISDDGRTIVGRGLNPLGRDEAWVAIIPEPSTTALLGLGLGLLSLPGIRRTR